MAHALPLPPPGFDGLSVEEQIDYVQSLWDRIAAKVDHVPLQRWQQALLEERLEAHRRTPSDVRPWREVIEQVEKRLRSNGRWLIEKGPSSFRLSFAVFFIVEAEQAIVLAVTHLHRDAGVWQTRT